MEKNAFYIPLIIYGFNLSIPNLITNLFYIKINILYNYLYKYIFSVYERERGREGIGWWCSSTNGFKGEKKIKK